MDYLKELTGMLGAQALQATGDERFLKIAAEATTAAADGLREDNIRAAEREPRFAKQASIEASIMAFRPDFCEAAEILDALSGRLARSYCPMDYKGEAHRALLAVFEAADALRKALDAADERVPQ